MKMTNGHIIGLAKALFAEQKQTKRLDGWLFIKEIEHKYADLYKELPAIERKAELLCRVAEELPISISDNAVFAGTQNDAFARSYALINPAFKVESFSGYCDPTAVFNDIEPNDDIPAERIEKMREADRRSEYVKALSRVYDDAHPLTDEATYFIEQVTGHVIPDFRPVLKDGVLSLIKYAEEKILNADEAQKSGLKGMRRSLDAVLIFSERYRRLALSKAESTADGDIKERMLNIADTLSYVPANGAATLSQAIQIFILMWQVMCIEQAPNPFAFSVGNADRIFEPYRAKEGLDRETSVALFSHLLAFYNVADRSWAISQNLILSGRDADGNDLTNPMTYAIMDAYYEMNFPQPILSVKLHKNTPDKVYEEMGRFFFTPGCLTPSLFNDDMMFELLQKSGIDKSDIPDYSIAGCQEPLIMGKDNGNTTNSWLNLAKVLELTLNGGVSALSGLKTLDIEPENAVSLLENVKERFYANLEKVVSKMVESANSASRAVSLLTVPFLSASMGCLETGYDMRDINHQGTKYNGSGCLIHGSAVVADSFVAIKHLLNDRPQDAGRLIRALQDNFENDEELREYLLSCPKFGNNDAEADAETAEVCSKAADLVNSSKNYLGNPFRADFSTPSTHLLYGYQVGALPNGRKARDMLNYGIDPLYGDAQAGLGFRTLSVMKLPFMKMTGGCASHFGIDPKYFTSESYSSKGMEFKTKVINPLFFNPLTGKEKPFYLYVNVTTPETLRKVLANPEKYAPNGVYIMRIHGTFVNFLDLSPAIQQDIINRLDPKSTGGIEC